MNSAKRSKAAREKERLRQRAWRAANPDKTRGYTRTSKDANREANRAYDRSRRAKARAAVFAHYGQVCICCGSTDRLTIDHVRGNGKAHRAEIGRKGGADFYMWLMRAGFPDGFQALCGPCNSSKNGGDRCRLTAAEHAALQAGRPAAPSGPAAKQLSLFD